MKKLFFLIVLCNMVFSISAQDIKDIRNYSLLGQTQKGKDAVDKFLSVPKNALKPEGWFTKECFTLNHLRILPNQLVKVLS